MAGIYFLPTILRFYENSVYTILTNTKFYNIIYLNNIHKGEL